MGRASARIIRRLPEFSQEVSRTHWQIVDGARGGSNARASSILHIRRSDLPSASSAKMKSAFSFEYTEGRPNEV